MEEVLRQAQTVQSGFSGDRTEHVLWRLANGAVDGISPKLAVVMIGTNNTGQRQDPAEATAAGVRAIVDDLQRRLPKTTILLLAVFQESRMPTASSDSSTSRSTNASPSSPTALAFTF